MKSNAPPFEHSAKDRLLQAAIKIFASNGYEGASTRQLTGEAGVNISAIPYYFKDKEGLYRAVLESIAHRAKTELAPRAAFIRDSLKNGDLDREAARALAHDLFSAFIRFLLGDELSPSIGRIFMREQMDPTPSFTAFYETTMRPMHETLTALVARMTGLPYPSEQATLCAHTLLGSISVFKTHRELALRRLGWKKYGTREIDKITEIVLRHADIIFDSTYQKGSRQS
jgi:TetR/AcrR family transcriptional regulator, regulator of cefoperazone and chloramphenicol sensitivity